MKGDNVKSNQTTALKGDSVKAQLWHLARLAGGSGVEGDYKITRHLGNKKRGAAEVIGGHPWSRNEDGRDPNNELLYLAHQEKGLLVKARMEDERAKSNHRSWRAEAAPATGRRIMSSRNIQCLRAAADLPLPR